MPNHRTSEYLRYLGVGGASQQSRYGLLDGRLLCIYNGASPQPDEACALRAGVVGRWGGVPAGAQGSSQCELFIRRLQRSGGRCRPSLQPEPVMTLPRTAAEVLSGHVTLEVRCTDRVLLTFRQPRLQYGQGIHGFFCHHRGNQFVSSTLMHADDRAVRRRHPPLHRHAAAGPGPVRQGAEQGPGRQGVPGREVRRRPDPVRRRGPGEGPGVADLAAPGPGDREAVPVAVPGPGDGQPLVLLRVRRRFRPVLRQVLRLFPLHRADLLQRARVRQAAVPEGRDRVHLAGQRVRHGQRRRGGPADLRRADRSEDLPVRRQVAGPAAAAVHPRRRGRRLPLAAVGLPGRVLHHHGPGPAAEPGGSSSSS